MAEVNVDFIGKNGGRGPVASLLTQGRLDVGAMRPYFDTDGHSCISTYMGGDPKKEESYITQFSSNAVLRREEWMELDRAIAPITREKLVGINDLTSAGLIYNLTNAMGTTVIEYHDMSDGLEAVMTMDGVTRAQNDRQEFGTHYLPIPIIHADYEINERFLQVSRRMGNPLDASLAEFAARRVAEKLEKMLFTNTQYAFGGGTIYSYVNHPNRNIALLDSAWTNSGVTGKQILLDVKALKDVAIADLKFGPYMLYIPTAFETRLDEDYSDVKGDITIRDRIMRISGLKGITVAPYLAANQLLLVQMTSDTVRLVKGLGLQNVQWSTEGNMIHKYKVLTIQVPQIRADYEGRSGIVHASFSA